MRSVESYSQKTYIPYVWGGNKVGEQTTCNECRACISQKHKLKVERRAGACSACRQCGVDCSHFVNHVFADAGLEYPYLSTAKLRRLNAAGLKQNNLIEVGHDLSHAQPGDLLVTARHVVLILAVKAAHTFDFIHVSRAIKHGRVGGVEVVRDADVHRFRGKSIRILRHKDLDGLTPIKFPLLTPVPPDLTGQRFVRALW